VPRFGDGDAATGARVPAAGSAAVPAPAPAADSTSSPKSAPSAPTATSAGVGTSAGTGAAPPLPSSVPRDMTRKKIPAARSTPPSGKKSRKSVKSGSRASGRVALNNIASTRSPSPASVTAPVPPSTQGINRPTGAGTTGPLSNGRKKPLHLKLTRRRVPMYG
jgi:hypothetical protein